MWGKILTGFALGAVACAVMAGSDKQEKIDLINAGKAEAKAEYLVAIKKLEKQLEGAFKSINSRDGYFKAIIALEAVGVSCAACDGDFSDNEKEEIGEFVRGMLAQNIPEDIKVKIQSIYDNPPTIKEAYVLAEASGVPLDVYEDLINLVMQIDGIKEEEKAFLQAWNQLKVA